jgi:transcriptional regulator with XRE-family HTH domain
VSDLLNQLRNSFADEDYRYAYADSFMNSYVAAQIKVLRERNKLTQADLGQKTGTKQAGISRVENVNYSAWKVGTLRKIARALGVRLRITFEEWGTLPREIEKFTREALVREPFERDPVFSRQPFRPAALVRLNAVPNVQPVNTFDFYGMSEPGVPGIAKGSVMNGSPMRIGSAVRDWATAVYQIRKPEYGALLGEVTIEQQPFPPEVTEPEPIAEQSIPAAKIWVNVINPVPVSSAPLHSQPVYGELPPWLTKKFRQPQFGQGQPS